MDSILDKALKKKNLLEKELTKIKEFIFMYKSLDSGTFDEHSESARARFSQFVSKRAVVSTNAEKDMQNTSHKHKIIHNEDQKRVRGTPPAVIIPRIEDMLRLKGLPMTRSEVLQRLLNDGIIVGGGDKSKNVGTIMWRNQDKFVNLPGKGYWLRNIPCREANYIPVDKKVIDDLI